MMYRYLRSVFRLSGASMASIASCSASTNTAVVEIRNMMIHTNSYLEDIARYAKATYRDFGEKIDTLNNQIATKL